MKALIVSLAVSFVVLVFGVMQGRAGAKVSGKVGGLGDVGISIYRAGVPDIEDKGSPKKFWYTVKCKIRRLNTTQSFNVCAKGPLSAHYLGNRRCESRHKGFNACKCQSGILRNPGSPEPCS